MTRRDSEDNKGVALYWDFENLHASLVEARQGEGAYNKPDGRFKSQEPLIDVQAIIEMASSYGPLAINRAYCNWQYFGRYRDALLQGSVELIQLFSPGASAKNGADIKLCLDAVDDVGRYPHIGTVVIVGGDSDFMPVVQKIKATGRTLVGVGGRKSTNRHWARSCHAFRYYENLVQPLVLAQDSPSDQPAADLFKRALRLLVEARGDAWVSQAAVWHMVKRLDPMFDPLEHGYPSFAAMVSAFEAWVAQRPDVTGPVLSLR